MRSQDLEIVEKVCLDSTPLYWTDEKNNDFVEACKVMAQFHKENCSEIEYIYKKRNFEPSSLNKESDLEMLPSLGVQAMKYHLLLSKPESELKLKLTSSGTRGQKTQIWFDRDSLRRVEEMLLSLWKELGMYSEKPSNYLMFIYNPKQAKDLGIAYTIENQTKFSPANKITFAINKVNEEWFFDKELVLRTLQEYINEGLPVRISGIPGFILEFVESLESPLKLPPKSLLFTGGGWKSNESKKVEKPELRRRLSNKLGIPIENMRDGYGMAEHSSPYWECHQHRLHVPTYNRIFIRDPETMRFLPEGEIGLIELVTPFNSMMPNLSVLSTDLGRMFQDPCPCGRNAPTFEILGRAGLSKHKGCALTANDLVKRSQ